MMVWPEAAKTQFKRFTIYVLIGVVGTIALAIGQDLFGIVGPYAPAVAWAGLCVLSAARRHALAWSLLVLVPLAMLCLQWLTSGYPVRAPEEDPFGIQLATIAAFIFVSIMTAISGTIFINATSHERAQLPSFRGTWDK